MFSVEKTTQILIEFGNQYPSKTKEIVEIFISSLKDSRAMHELSRVIKLLERTKKKQNKEDRLYIRLFESVSEETIQKIKKFVGVANESNVDIEIDKEIKGGFIAYYHGSIFDASIKNQFIKLKNTLK
jgi:F0F1-type ATP synthase delta subunit